MTNLSRLLTRVSGADHGVADGFARDDEFDAAVLLAARRSFVRGHRLRFAKPARGDRVCGNALLNEEFPDRGGAAFGELLIIFISADANGLAFDL